MTEEEISDLPRRGRVDPRAAAGQDRQVPGEHRGEIAMSTKKKLSDCKTPEEAALLMAEDDDVWAADGLEECVAAAKAKWASDANGNRVNKPPSKESPK